MANIAILVGGAVVNAVALTGSGYVEKILAGDGGAMAEKKRHDKALEAYETAQARYAHEGTKLLDWIEVNRENKELAKQNFTNTDYAFKLYNQAHPDMKLTMPIRSRNSPISTSPARQTSRPSLFLSVVACS